MLVDFESTLLDSYGNCLLQGVYVNFALANGDAAADAPSGISGDNKHGSTGPAPFYTYVEEALQRVGGVRGSYLSLLMNPVNDLELDFRIEDMCEQEREAFVTHHLRLHLRRQAASLAASDIAGVGGAVQHEQNEKGDIIDTDMIDRETVLASLPTMLLCKIDNVVHVNLDTRPEQLFVNPNVPVSDWFRCANQLLADGNCEERLLPYEKQKCSNDVIYSAVCCTVDEQEKWKELSEYGTKMGHDTAKVWDVLTNYTVALLRRDPDRRVVEITMFKDRILRGVLLGGIDVSEMLKVTQRLEINIL
jgi:hypothetical protein